MNYFSNKSHVYTTTKTCEAMNLVGDTKVTLVSTDNSLLQEGAKNKFFDGLNIKPFDMVSIDSWSNSFKNSSNRLVNWLETLTTDLSMLRFVFRSRKDFDVLYFRDPTLFFSVLTTKIFLRKPIFMELHAILSANLKRKMTEFLAKRADGVISISHGLKEYYDNINNVGIVSFCSASSMEDFNKVTESKEELRGKLNLPKDKILIGYAGNLSYTGNYDSYGTEEIINSLQHLDERFVFVGVGKKNSNDTKHLEKLAADLGVIDRVIFIHSVPKKEVAEYLMTFDILVHPSAGRRVANSPAKLFEWLSSGKPIIAAKTQAIAEILTNEKNSLLVDYEDPNAWSLAINSIVEERGLKEKLINGANETAKKYTWEKRGEAIIKFINENK